MLNNHPLISLPTPKLSRSTRQPYPPPPLPLLTEISTNSDFEPHLSRSSQLDAQNGTSEQRDGTRLIRHTGIQALLSVAQRFFSVGKSGWRWGR